MGKRGSLQYDTLFWMGAFKVVYKKKLKSKHFFHFTVLSSIFRAKPGNIRMVFRGLICAYERSEVFDWEGTFEPTTPNKSQHVATRWPNAHNMLCPTMLQHVVLACCDHLAGALVFQMGKNCWGVHCNMILHSPLQLSWLTVKTKMVLKKWKLPKMNDF